MAIHFVSLEEQNCRSGSRNVSKGVSECDFRRFCRYIFNKEATVFEKAVKVSEQPTLEPVGENP